MRWTTKEMGEWIAHPSPPIHLRAVIYAIGHNPFCKVEIFHCVYISMPDTVADTGAPVKCHSCARFSKRTKKHRILPRDDMHIFEKTIFQKRWLMMVPRVMLMYLPPFSL